ncbi:hypothetical protein EPR50_G00162820 [Perca flavescens]|uniref:Uncharacterized protein n=1 Tax=Perca flavescens TaxID=8167 RepID=A0A484CN72_PERFV|nr:hypothetical protein EPR50_G00162820 [Perca flavescens]
MASAARLRQRQAAAVSRQRPMRRRPHPTRITADARIKATGTEPSVFTPWILDSRTAGKRFHILTVFAQQQGGQGVIHGSQKKSRLIRRFDFLHN